MNKVYLTGRLTAEPDITKSTAGNKIARYRLAVDRDFKQEGQPEADFVNCVCFNNNANFAELYLHKGTKILIEGSISTGSYEKNNIKFYTTDIIVNRHEFCESKKAENKPAAASSATAPYNAPAADICPAYPDPNDFTVVDDEDLPF